MGSKSGRIQLRRLNRPSAEVAYLQDSVQMALEQVQSVVARTTRTSIVTVNQRPDRTWSYLQPTADSVLNYRFDGTADMYNCRVDSTNDLTATTYYTTAINGQPCAAFPRDTTAIAWNASSNANLEIIGSISIEMVLHVIDNAVVADDIFIAYGYPESGSESTANNVSWSVGIEPDTNRFRFHHEESSTTVGLNVNAYGGVCPNHGLFYLCVTRASNGTTVKFYVDGVLVDTQEMSKPPTSTSGTSRRVFVGGFYNGSAGASGTVALCAIQSINVSPSVLSDADVAARYADLVS